MPVALAPVGMAGMMARRGEVQGACAAETTGIPYTLSTVGVCSTDEIRAASSKPFWFQLYMLNNREYVQTILQRAQNAGCKVLVFTVDLAVPGLRHRDAQNGVLDAEGGTAALHQLSQVLPKLQWAYDVGRKGKPHSLGNLADLVPEATNLDAYKRFVDDQFDASVTWEDIAWLREQWSGKILLKGILDPEDAQKADDVGVDGVVVSNHGGRQLDSVASTISKLPSIVERIGGQAEIYLDGGVRSGIDVLKAVALGANGVLIGRPWVWAVAGAGQAGLERYLATMQKEIAAGLALMGINRIDELNETLLDKA
jgi:L-lactate dehydrogenase (cytochrome)